MSQNNTKPNPPPLPDRSKYSPVEGEVIPPPAGDRGVIECPDCRGYGWIPEHMENGELSYAHLIMCTRCDGRRFVFDFLSKAI